MCADGNGNDKLKVHLVRRKIVGDLGHKKREDNIEKYVYENQESGGNEAAKLRLYITNGAAKK